MPRVFVTGIGAITAIGNSVSENLESLRSGKTGIGKANFLSSKYADLLPFGEVGLDTETLQKITQLQDQQGVTRTHALAIKAFREAVEHAQLTHSEISSPKTAFISASTVGGMCLTDELYQDANLKSEGSEFLAAYGCGAHTLFMAQKFGIKGFTDTINTACSSSANSIMLGARLIKSGRADRAIVGGVDSLAKFTINGFNALQILSDEPCRPFDQTRKGLNLGEGAAYLVLESEELVQHKQPLAEVAGYGNSNDAYHPSSLSAEAVGVIAAISKALQTAQLAPSAIGLVNAHGTATENNDLVELTGLKKIFGEIPPFHSTKSYTGHTLGAAGAIEAVFSILSLTQSEFYPSLNFANPLEEIPVLPILQFQQNKPIQHVLSNSFGFAGNCTSLVFSKIE